MQFEDFNLFEISHSILRNAGHLAEISLSEHYKTHCIFHRLMKARELHAVLYTTNNHIITTDTAFLTHLRSTSAASADAVTGHTLHHSRVLRPNARIDDRH